MPSLLRFRATEGRPITRAEMFDPSGDDVHQSPHITAAAQD
ncbi:hypothetical protein [Mycobacterium sp. 852002-51057_SCH5723018]|nr:hypothetical protein [Mycobacterium sp. 852002-51057_SCH5723018]